MRLLVSSAALAFCLQTDHFQEADLSQVIVWSPEKAFRNYAFLHLLAFGVGNQLLTERIALFSLIDQIHRANPSCVDGGS
jgi:hypothetical protein